jgi:flagellar biosynthesis/type III secretory pathway protein FliH
LPEGCDRDFTTRRWQGEAVQSFANDDFGLNGSGFMLDARPISHDALSESAQRAFSLLDDVKKQHELAKKALEEQEAASANAHLPFVLDVYEAPEVKRPVQVAPTVYEDAGDANAFPVEPELAIEEGSDEVTHGHSAADSQLPDADDVSHDDTPTDEVQPVAAQATAEVEPATHVGIPAEEVSQREADQFEKGLAQGVEQGLAQGLETGLAQGLEQGLAQGLEQGLAEGREQGMKEGLALAEEQARELQARAEQEAAVTNDVMAEVSAKLNALLEDPTQFFEPLKRLALHLAEQVVKCELRTSSHAVEQLIQRCLDDLDHPAKGAVVIELNPEDKARLQESGSAFIQGMRLDAVHDMKPGSVRVFANDMIVEDLVEHRLEALARTLLIDVDSWRKQSALVKPEAPEDVEGMDAQADTAIEETADVHP